MVTYKVMANCVKLRVFEYGNELVAPVCPQARSPEDSAGEGSGERTTGTNHRERSQRHLPGNALYSTVFLIFALK